MVIGPTPPGTGVIAPAMPCASAKATSPTSSAFPPGRANAVDADVDDDGAGLDPVALDHLRLAHRRDQNIGAPTGRPGGRGVLECAIVTVQFSAEQQRRHRLADDVGAAEHDRIGAGQIARSVSRSSIRQP